MHYPITSFPILAALFACAPKPEPPDFVPEEGVECGINPAEDLARPQLEELGLLEPDDGQEICVIMCADGDWHEDDIEKKTSSSLIDKINGFGMNWCSDEARDIYIIQEDQDNFYPQSVWHTACDDGKMLFQFSFATIGSRINMFADIRCDFIAESDSRSLGTCHGQIYDDCVYEGGLLDSLDQTCEEAITFYDSYFHWNFQ